MIADHLMNGKDRRLPSSVDTDLASPLQDYYRSYLYNGINNQFDRLNNIMKLSIIIVNWNTKGLLDRCLGSIYLNPPLVPFEIIVVDNASIDGSPEMIKRRFPSVKLICSESNLGFAKGNNAGIAHARGKYCLLLNPDTVVLPNAFDKMIEYIDRNPKVGIVGASLLDENHNPCASYGYFPRVLSTAIEFSGLYHHSPFLKKLMRPLGMVVTDTKPLEVEYVSGAALLIRTSIIKELGGLSEDYFAYFEETDLCFQVRQKSWKIIVLPNAKIIHFGGASFQGINDKRWELLHKGLFTYLRRNRGSFSVLSLIGILKPSIKDIKDRKKNYDTLIHLVIHEALPDRKI